MPALRAGLAYWAVVFALAFALGVVRTLWLTPVLGQLAAVAIEVPIILMASWLAAKRLTARFGIATSRAALAMGFIAFALLMLSELALGAILGGQTIAIRLDRLASLAGLLGLSGQIMFALMPLIARQR